MNMENTLLTLVKQIGISGHEFKLSDMIKEMFDKYCDDVKIDAFGNVVAVQNPNAKEDGTLLEAHIDQIGLIVSEIKDNGRVIFLPVGGIDASTLPSSTVVIHGKEDVFGIIGAKPPHLQTKGESDTAYTFDDLYIDTGFDFDELSKKIRIGDVISLSCEPKKLLNGRIASSAIDNRGGVAVLLEAAKRLKDDACKKKVIYLLSVQEELGLRGATVASYGLSPETAIVVDVTFGYNPMVSHDESFTLGDGAMIAVGPNVRADISDKLIELAKKHSIPFDIEVAPSSTGTDAWVMQTQGRGIPVGLVSIPLSNMHSIVETVDINDMKAVCSLLCHYIKEA